MAFLLVPASGVELGFDCVSAEAHCAQREPVAVIELKSGTRIWIAAGFTDLRRGFQGLSSIVETVLEQAPFSGHGG